MLCGGREGMGKGKKIVCGVGGNELEGKELFGELWQRGRNLKKRRGEGREMAGELRGLLVGRGEGGQQADNNSVL